MAQSSNELLNQMVSVAQAPKRIKAELLSPTSESRASNNDTKQELYDYEIEEPPTPTVRETSFLLQATEEEELPDVSVDNPNYFDSFFEHENALSSEEAYMMLCTHTRYTPYLADLTDSVPPMHSSHYHSSGGFFAISRRNNNDTSCLSVPPNQYIVPGCHLVVTSRSINIGKFIRTTFVLEDCELVVVNYVPNVSKLYIVPKHPNLTYFGTVEFSEAFQFLLCSDSLEAEDKRPQLAYQTLPNYCFTMTAKSQDCLSTIACDDGCSWVKKRKDLPDLHPKWEYRYLHKTDVEKNVYRPFKLSKNDIDALSVEDKKGIVILRRKRASHPSFSVQRYITFFANFMYKQKIEYDRVLYQYVVTGDITEGSMTKTNSRSGPKEMIRLRQAMHFRNVDGTKQFMAHEHSVSVSSRKVHNASRRNKAVFFHRKRIGDKQKIDFLELIKSTLTNKGGYTVVQNITSPTGFHVQLLPDHFQCVLANLPTKSELAKHRKKVAKLDGLPNRGARNAFVNKEFVPLQNSNGFLSGVTGIIMVDVTFGLSPWYVTVVYCSVPCFATKRSGKMRFVPIAIIYHPSKDASIHLSVVSAINSMFATFPQYHDRRFSCLLTDGEHALSAYNTAKVCEEAVHLKCAVHLRDNMTQRSKHVDTQRIFGSVDVSQGCPLVSVEDESFIQNNQPKIKRVLENSLLGAYTHEEYLLFMKEVLDDPLVPSIVKRFVKAKGVSLFEYYSLRRRLEAGMITQFATTNSLEGFNHTVKTVFDGKQAPSISLPKFLEFVEAQLKEFCNALMGVPSEVSYVGDEKWNLLDDSEKDMLLSKLGLQLPIDKEWSTISSSFVKAITPDRLGKIRLLYNEYSINTQEPSYVILLYRNLKKPVSFLLTLKRTSSAITTVCHRNCKQTSICCDHQLLYFMSLNEVDRQLFIAGHHTVDKHRDILSATTARGTGSKRKGDIRSKSNNTRKVDEVADGSIIREAILNDRSADIGAINRNDDDDEEIVSDDEEIVSYDEEIVSVGENTVSDMQDIIDDNQDFFSNATEMVSQDHHPDQSTFEDNGEYDSSASEDIFNDSSFICNDVELENEDVPSASIIPVMRTNRRRKSDPFKSPSISAVFLKHTLKNSNRIAPRKTVRFEASKQSVVSDFAIASSSAIPKRRGRPPKQVAEKETGSEKPVVSVVARLTAVAKQRGRPPKQVAEKETGNREPMVSVVARLTAVAKQRDRPPKQVAEKETGNREPMVSVVASSTDVAKQRAPPPRQVAQSITFETNDNKRPATQNDYLNSPRASRAAKRRTF